MIYVSNCELKMKKFDSFEKMGKFVKSFWKKYPDHLSVDSGYWIDYAITGITGDVHFFTDGLKVE